MAKKTHRVSWISGHARNSRAADYERKGVNCTEDEVEQVKEDMRFALSEKVQEKPEKYGSDWIEAHAREDLD